MAKKSNMLGYHKRFDPALYKQNDAIAKLSTVRIFSKIRGYTIEENEKKRGVDLLLYKGKKHVGYIECEIKKMWVGKEFPYPNVQFPERKEKFSVLDKPTIFLMFNSDQTGYLAVSGKNLRKSPKVEVSNRFARSGEYFFQVPVKKVHMNDIKSALKKLEEK